MASANALRGNSYLTAADDSSLLAQAPKGPRSRKVIGANQRPIHNQIRGYANGSSSTGTPSVSSRTGRGNFSRRHRTPFSIRRRSLEAPLKSLTALVGSPTSNPRSERPRGIDIPEPSEKASLAFSYGLPLPFRARGSPSRSHATMSSFTSAWDGRDGYGRRKCQLDLALGLAVQAVMRPTDRLRDKRAFAPGTIISAPFHTQSRSDLVDNQSDNISLSGFGAVHSKYRKMVVLETWGEHCLCLPIYSYQQCGLAGRRQAISNEYIGIRDRHAAHPEPADTPEEPLRAVRHPDWHHAKTFITGRSVVKLTEPCSHQYTSKCSMEGHVPLPDFNRLYKLYMKVLQEKMERTLDA